MTRAMNVLLTGSTLCIPSHAAGALIEPCHSVMPLMQLDLMVDTEVCFGDAADYCVSSTLWQQNQVAT